MFYYSTRCMLTNSLSTGHTERATGNDLASDLDNLTVFHKCCLTFITAVVDMTIVTFKLSCINLFCASRGRELKVKNNYKNVRPKVQLFVSCVITINQEIKKKL